MDKHQTNNTGGPILTKSDYYNPITNMKLKKGTDSSKDNTLELLAVPALCDLELERDNVIKFAE